MLAQQLHSTHRHLHHQGDSAGLAPCRFAPLFAVDPFLGITVRFWLQGAYRLPHVEEVRGSSMLASGGPVSSATAGTDPEHPNTVVRQRGSSPAALVGVGEGGTAGAGSSRVDMWGNARRETRGYMGGGVKIH